MKYIIIYILLFSSICFAQVTTKNHNIGDDGITKYGLPYTNMISNFADNTFPLVNYDVAYYGFNINGTYADAVTLTADSIYNWGYRDTTYWQIQFKLKLPVDPLYSNTILCMMNAGASKGFQLDVTPSGKVQMWGFDTASNIFYDTIGTVTDSLLHTLSFSYRNSDSTRIYILDGTTVTFSQRKHYKMDVTKPLIFGNGFNGRFVGYMRNFYNYSSNLGVVSTHFYYMNTLSVMQDTTQSDIQSRATNLAGRYDGIIGLGAWGDSCDVTLINVTPKKYFSKFFPLIEGDTISGSHSNNAGVEGGSYTLQGCLYRNTILHKTEIAIAGVFNRINSPRFPLPYSYGKGDTSWYAYFVDSNGVYRKGGVKGTSGSSEYQDYCCPFGNDRLIRVGSFIDTSSNNKICYHIEVYEGHGDTIGAVGTGLNNRGLVCKEDVDFSGIVGGQFTSANGTSVNHIFRLKSDLTVEALDTGLYYNVWGIEATDPNFIYASGEQGMVCKFNRVTKKWTNMYLPTTATVFAIKLFRGELYALGASAVITENKLFVYRGGTWITLCTLSGCSNAQPVDAEVRNNVLYVVYNGYYVTPTGGATMVCPSVFAYNGLNFYRISQSGSDRPEFVVKTTWKDSCLAFGGDGYWWDGKLCWNLALYYPDSTYTATPTIVAGTIDSVFNLTLPISVSCTAICSTGLDSVRAEYVRNDSTATKTGLRIYTTDLNKYTGSLTVTGLAYGDNVYVRYGCFVNGSSTYTPYSKVPSASTYIKSYTAFQDTANMWYPLTVTTTVWNYCGIDSVHLLWKKGINGVQSSAKFTKLTDSTFTLSWNPTTTSWAVGDTIYPSYAYYNACGYSSTVTYQFIVKASTLYATNLAQTWWGDSNVTVGTGASKWQNTKDTLSFYQSTGGSQPLVITNGLGTHTTLRFNGSAYYMLFHATTYDSTTWVFVYKETGFGAVANFLLGGATSGIFQYGGWLTAGYGETDGSNSRYVAKDLTDTNWCTRGFEQKKLYSNGVEATYVLAQNMGNISFTLLGKRGDGYYASLDLAFVGRWTENVSSANQYAIHKYLKYVLGY